MQGISKGQRTTARRQVRIPARCELGALAVGGLIRDLNGAGAFIGEDSLVFSSEEPSASPLSLLHIGDQFLLTFLKSPIMNERSMLATVCWQGSSIMHSCHGLGVRFDPERPRMTRSQAVAA